MDACLEATTTPEKKVGVSEDTPNGIWISLVRCLVLEHKEQSTVEVSFAMTFNVKEMDSLRSIVHSEVTGECHTTAAESLLDFTTKLQFKAQKEKSTQKN